MRGNMILGILTAIIGLLVAVNPEASLEVIVVLLGVTAIVNSFYSLKSVRILSDDSAFRKTVIVRSLIGLIAGLVAVIFPFAMADIIQRVVKLLLVVLGCYLVVSAILGFVMLSRLSGAPESKKNLLVEIMCSILIAVFLFILPADFGVRIIRILGIVLAVFGALYTLYAFRKKKVVELNTDDVTGADPIGFFVKSNIPNRIIC